MSVSLRRGYIRRSFLRNSMVGKGDRRKFKRGSKAGSKLDKGSFKKKKYTKGDIRRVVSTTVSSCTGTLTDSTDPSMEKVVAALGSSLYMGSIQPLSIVYSKKDIVDMCKQYSRTKMTAFKVEIGIANTSKGSLTFAGYFDYSDSYSSAVILTKGFLGSVSDKMKGVRVETVLPGGRKTILMSAPVYGGYMNVPEGDISDMLAQRKAPWSFLYGIDRTDKSDITVTVKTTAYIRFKQVKVNDTEVKVAIASAAADLANRKSRQQTYEDMEGKLAAFVQKEINKMS
jgi:hypothetical protein